MQRDISIPQTRWAGYRNSDAERARRALTGPERGPDIADSLVRRLAARDRNALLHAPQLHPFQQPADLQEVVESLIEPGLRMGHREVERDLEPHGGVADGVHPQRHRRVDPTPAAPQPFEALVHRVRATFSPETSRKTIMSATSPAVDRSDPASLIRGRRQARLTSSRRVSFGFIAGFVGMLMGRSGGGTDGVEQARRAIGCSTPSVLPGGLLRQGSLCACCETARRRLITCLLGSCTLDPLHSARRDGDGLS